jgi:hypothetical protein
LQPLTSFEETGPAAVALLVGGYASFWFLERRGHAAGAHLKRSVIVPAMAVHSLLDGGSLALAFAAGTGATPALCWPPRPSRRRCRPSAFDAGRLASPPERYRRFGICTSR